MSALVFCRAHGDLVLVGGKSDRYQVGHRLSNTCACLDDANITLAQTRGNLVCHAELFLTLLVIGIHRTQSPGGGEGLIDTTFVTERERDVVGIGAWGQRRALRAFGTVATQREVYARVPRARPERSRGAAASRSVVKALRCGPQGQGSSPGCRRGVCATGRRGQRCRPAARWVAAIDRHECGGKVEKPMRFEARQDDLRQRERIDPLPWKLARVGLAHDEALGRSSHYVR